MPEYQLDTVLVDPTRNLHNNIVEYPEPINKPINMSSKTIIGKVIDSSMDPTNGTPPPPLHRQMVTRSQKGIVEQNPKYAFISSCSSTSKPKNSKDALNNPLWLEPTREELTALEQNNTWVFVARTWL